MLGLYLAWRVFRLARRLLVVGVIAALVAALASGGLGRLGRMIQAPGLGSELVTVRHDVQTGLQHALSPQISARTGRQSR